MKFQREKTAGFTLIEVLEAFTVLALVLGAMYRVFVSSERQATQEPAHT